MKVGGNKFLKTETVNVISSILRTVPIGIYQKTLADGLAFAGDLTNADLQRTNLQNARIENKTEKVILDKADLFMSNLSYALIKNVKAHEIVLYNAFLNETVIKNSDFTKANFEGADLTNIKFENVTLKGAKFSKAKNVPPEIMEHLNDGIFIDESSVTTADRYTGNIIFFSMPGNMSKNDELSHDLIALSVTIASFFHDKWVRNRIEDGLSYGPERDDARKLHPCLVPYEELPEREKDYDRATSQETLKLILSSGFAISKK